MKFFLKNCVFLLTLVFPSIVLSKTFTNCGGDFNFFLNEAEEHATELGVRGEVLRKIIRQTKFNPKIIDLDRKQRSFKLSFLDFSKRAINDYRLVNGKKKSKNTKLFLIKLLTYMVFQRKS